MQINLIRPASAIPSKSKPFSGEEILTPVVNKLKTKQPKSIKDKTLKSTF